MNLFYYKERNVSVFFRVFPVDYLFKNLYKKIIKNNYYFN